MKSETATVKLMPQEREGNYLFNGQIVMTSNFQNTFGDKVFYIILESLALIREIGNCDYFQVLEFKDIRYYLIQDGPEDGGICTFLLCSDY